MNKNYSFMLIWNVTLSKKEVEGMLKNQIIKVDNKSGKLTKKWWKVENNSKVLKNVEYSYENSEWGKQIKNCWKIM